jgi:hypothetical protein
LTYGIMGREGYEEFKEEWDGREPKRDEWIIR